MQIEKNQVESYAERMPQVGNVEKDQEKEVLEDRDCSQSIGFRVFEIDSFQYLDVCEIFVQLQHYGAVRWSAERIVSRSK